MEVQYRVILKAIVGNKYYFDVHVIVEKDYSLVERKYFDKPEHATRMQKRRLNLLFSYQFQYSGCSQKLNKTIRYL